RYPSLYQIFTRIWLRELARELGRPVTLGDVPDARLAQVGALGFDWLWLLGVWQTGAAGRKVSLLIPEWQPGYAADLPGFTDADVCGSPFSVPRHPVLREAMIEELLKVAALCDGVRCDMAMLLLPEVFLKTWGDRALPRDGTPPVDRPFWPEAIARVRRHFPDFLFLAEVYWDLEWTLQQQGFDYTLDKRLYDRLRTGDAVGVRAHLGASLE